VRLSTINIIIIEKKPQLCPIQTTFLLLRNHGGAFLWLLNWKVKIILNRSFGRKTLGN
jgi:hypothetical protein